jgi:hypothetical protein
LNIQFQVCNGEWSWSYISITPLLEERTRNDSSAPRGEGGRL